MLFIEYNPKHMLASKKVWWTLALILFAAAVIILVVFSFDLLTVFAPDETNSSINVGLANPASVNCETQGGQLVMKEKPNGSQYALCYFDDNRACEEWAMFRGECPVGGMKTTGYDTEAQRFCAWSGGSTTATENALCVLPDGSACLSDDFYLGQCEE